MIAAAIWADWRFLPARWSLGLGFPWAWKGLSICKLFIGKVKLVLLKPFLVEKSESWLTIYRAVIFLTHLLSHLMNSPRFKIKIFATEVDLNYYSRPNAFLRVSPVVWSLLHRHEYWKIIKSNALRRKLKKKRKKRAIKKVGRRNI